MPDLTFVQQQLVNSSEIDDNEINQNWKVTGYVVVNAPASYFKSIRDSFK